MKFKTFAEFFLSIFLDCNCSRFSNNPWVSFVFVVQIKGNLTNSREAFFPD